MTQLVNKVVSMLATTDDPAAPGTKVLDNTLIYVMSEIGDGQDHNARQRDPLPADARLACRWSRSASAAGAIKSGQVVQFPIDDEGQRPRTVNRPAADLYLTMARAMGAANVTFPGQTGVLPGVLA